MWYDTRQSVEIEIQLGLDTKRINATVIQYLGNDEYVVEGENGNRYIRKVVSGKNGNLSASKLEY